MNVIVKVTNEVPRLSKDSEVNGLRIDVLITTLVKVDFKDVTQVFKLEDICVIGDSCIFNKGEVIDTLKGKVFKVEGRGRVNFKEDEDVGLRGTADTVHGYVRKAIIRYGNGLRLTLVPNVKKKKSKRKRKCIKKNVS